MAEAFKRQCVSFPPVLLTDLKAEAQRRDMSLSQLVRELVRAGRLGQQTGPDLQRAEGSNDDGR